jgi:uridine kinase
MNIENIVKAIKDSRITNKPVLIGIEGFGGSGKTTLSGKLKSKLGSAYVVNIDDFIIKEKLNEDNWDKGGFDRERLEKQVLLPATSNNAIQYQKLIWQTNKLSDFIEIPNVDYLIVEGISCYHPDIAKYYDFKIWVDTPMELAKERGYARDGSNENAVMWDLWSENDIKYKDRYHPELEADFVIDGTVPF